MGINEPTKRRALLFLNSRSRSGGNRTADGAVKQLEAGGFILTHGLCAQSEDMTREVSRHAHQVDLVNVGGGDGTVVLETGLPLGTLPFGTANDLARTLGIPSAPEAAAAVIVAGHTRRIDVGQVNDQFFVNVASMGLSVELARRMTGNLKRRLGRLSYPLAAIKTVLYARPFTAEVATADRTIQLRSLQIAVGNGVYYGGGVAVYEAAAIDGQWLDFYSVEPRRFWQWPLFLTAFRRGRNRNLVGLRSFAALVPLRSEPTRRCQTTPMAKSRQRRTPASSSCRAHRRFSRQRINPQCTYRSAPQSEAAAPDLQGIYLGGTQRH